MSAPDGGVDMSAPYPPLKSEKKPAAKRGRKPKASKPEPKVKKPAAPDPEPKKETMEPGMGQMFSNSETLSETAAEKLRLTVERIERLEEEKKEVAEQIKEVFGEAKALGYDTKALRAVIKMRKQDKTERQEFEAILDVYLDVMGEL